MYLIDSAKVKKIYLDDEAYCVGYSPGFSTASEGISLVGASAISYSCKGGNKSKLDIEWYTSYLSHFSKPSICSTTNMIDLNS